MNALHTDLLVVGAGMSGLVAAATAAEAGARVLLVHAGLGSFVYGAGSISEAPGGAAQTFFQSLAEAAGAPYHEEAQLPTMLGSTQPMALVPDALWGGRALPGSRVAVVGVEGMSSFDSRFVVERLGQGYVARDIALPQEDGVPHSALNIANRFDRDSAFRRLMAERLRQAAADCDQILLPACLGQHSNHSDLLIFAAEVGKPIGEMTTLPPSVAGLRLNNLLMAHLRRLGVEFVGGYPLAGLEIENGVCHGVSVAVPGRARNISARAVVLATGPHSHDLLPGWSGKADHLLRPLDGQGNVMLKGLTLAGALLAAGNGHAVTSGHAAALSALAQEESHAA